MIFFFRHPLIYHYQYKLPSSSAIPFIARSSYFRLDFNLLPTKNEKLTASRLFTLWRGVTRSFPPAHRPVCPLVREGGRCPKMTACCESLIGMGKRREDPSIAMYALCARSLGHYLPAAHLRRIHACLCFAAIRGQRQAEGPPTARSTTVEAGRAEVRDISTMCGANFFLTMLCCGAISIHPFIFSAGIKNIR